MIQRIESDILQGIIESRVSRMNTTASNGIENTIGHYHFKVVAKKPNLPIVMGSLASILISYSMILLARNFTFPDAYENVRIAKQLDDKLLNHYKIKISERPKFKEFQIRPMPVYELYVSAIHQIYFFSRKNSTRCGFYQPRLLVKTKI